MATLAAQLEAVALVVGAGQPGPAGLDRVPVPDVRRQLGQLLAEPAHELVLGVPLQQRAVDARPVQHERDGQARRPPPMMPTVVLLGTMPAC